MRVKVTEDSYIRKPDIVTRYSMLHRATGTAELVVNATTLVAVHPPDNKYFWRDAWRLYPVDTDFTVVFRKKGSCTATAWWIFTFDGDRWSIGTWDDIGLDDQIMVVKRVRGQFKELKGVIPWPESLEGLIALENL